jgi:hypothetical protein
MRSIDVHICLPGNVAIFGVLFLAYAGEYCGWIVKWDTSYSCCYFLLVKGPGLSARVLFQPRCVRTAELASGQLFVSVFD